MMSPARFTRQQLQRTACVALFAWVFALFSGVANACLIQPVAPADRQVEHAHNHAADESGERNQGSGKAGCLKFCADESSALAKSKASHADLPGPIFLATVHWPLATPVAAVAPWHLVERPASVGPPLFIRLLRLTI
jgi:hypothetical protein